MTEKQIQEMADKSFRSQYDDGFFSSEIQLYRNGFIAGYKAAQPSDEKLREIARTIEGKLLEKEAYGGYKGDVDNLEDIWFDYLKKELK